MERRRGGGSGNRRGICPPHMCVGLLSCLSLVLSACLLSVSKTDLNILYYDDNDGDYDDNNNDYDGDNKNNNNNNNNQ